MNNRNKVVNISNRDDRVLFILGTASQIPTRRRNPTAALFRWRDRGYLLDVGEGTQRQMFRMGLSVGDIDTVLISHFHGDHVLGLPGVVQSLSLQTENRTLKIIYPIVGTKYLQKLIGSSVFQPGINIVEAPISSEGEQLQDGDVTIYAYRLKHKTPSWGFVLREENKIKFDPEKLEAVGLKNNPLIKKISLDAPLEFEGRAISFDMVGEKKEGFRLGYIADTCLCPACDIIAQNCDLLICESTYLDEDAGIALENQHLTVVQAAEIAARNNVKTLVITHFSQRYQDRESEFLIQAKRIFPNTIMAEDLMTVYV